jgi:hypothetical protein
MSRLDKMAKRGANSFKAGMEFEGGLLETLKRTYDVQNGDCLCAFDTVSAGAEEGIDVPFHFRGASYGLEAKTLNASEGGQRKFIVKDGMLQLPDDDRAKIHKALLPPGFILWEGSIPSFLKGDRTQETWDKEAASFRDVYINADNTTVADFYKKKGTHYIQIEGKGLYHTGEDPCNFGVPLFTCTTRLRIRCKRHHGSVPGTVMAALNYNKNTLPKSPFCLMNGPLPPNLAQLN